MLDYLGGSNVITRVHKNRRGNLKKGPEKWQCEKDWAQNFWPWRWKEATAKECWWPLKAGKDQNNNNNRISWEPSEGVQPCQCFAFRSMTLILNLWSSELWWWCSSLSHIPLFETLCTAACQASLSFTISQSLFKFMSTELVMLSNHLILYHLLLLLPSIFAIIQVFSNELVLHQVAKVLELQHQSFQWIFRVDFL